MCVCVFAMTSFPGAAAADVCGLFGCGIIGVRRASKFCGELPRAGWCGGLMGIDYTRTTRGQLELIEYSHYHTISYVALIQ